MLSEEKIYLLVKGDRMLIFLIKEKNLFFNDSYMDLMEPLPVKILNKTHPRSPDHLKHTSFSNPFEVAVHTSELFN